MVVSSRTSTFGGSPSTSSSRRRAGGREFRVVGDVLPEVAEILGGERLAVGPACARAQDEGEDAAVLDLEVSRMSGAARKFGVVADQPRVAVDDHMRDVAWRCRSACVMLPPYRPMPWPCPSKSRRAARRAAAAAIGGSFAGLRPASASIGGSTRAGDWAPSRGAQDRSQASASNRRGSRDHARITTSVLHVAASAWVRTQWPCADLDQRAAAAGRARRTARGHSAGSVRGSVHQRRRNRASASRSGYGTAASSARV